MSETILYIAHRSIKTSDKNRIDSEKLISVISEEKELMDCIYKMNISRILEIRLFDAKKDFGVVDMPFVVSGKDPVVIGLNDIVDQLTETHKRYYSITNNEVHDQHTQQSMFERELELASSGDPTSVDGIMRTLNKQYRQQAAAEPNTDRGNISANMFDTTHVDEDKLPKEPKKPNYNASDEEWNKYDAAMMEYNEAMENISKPVDNMTKQDIYRGTGYEGERPMMMNQNLKMEQYISDTLRGESAPKFTPEGSAHATQAAHNLMKDLSSKMNTGN